MKSEHPLTKIRSASQTAEWVAWKRTKGFSVTMTNGCFDILHKGHNHHLYHAAELSSILVVAIDSDRRVKMLKGDDRPVNNQDDRAYNLACLGSVDAVFIFDGDLGNHIRSIRPDTYVKAGYTYATLNAEERDALDEIGAKLVFDKVESGYSTTNIINKIRENHV